MAEEYRVEVDLEDPERGHVTEKRVRALDLDDDVRIEVDLSDVARSPLRFLPF